MKQAVLITGHYYGSKRKAGFHNIAEALARNGWEILFFTSSISWLSILRNDYRMTYPVRREAGKMIDAAENIKSFVWFTPYHPANLRLSLLNRLSTKLFSNYGNISLGKAEDFIKNSDMFIFESTPGLFLFEQFKKLNPKARFVYRVSDDLRLLRVHPALLSQEKRILPMFDLVSVPSIYLYRLFEGLPNLKLHLHGIRKDLYNRDYSNPYAGSAVPNLIFVGVSHIDYDFLERASRLCPHCHFHMIGPITEIPARDNVTAYGEMPFEETIPYIKYANMGLQMLKYSPGIECITDSNKIVQYTYSKLPIIAPDFLRTKHAHMFYYKPCDDSSIKKAIADGLKFDRSKISVEEINSWDDLTLKLVSD